MDIRPAKSIKLKPHRFASQFRELDENERLHMEQSLDQFGFDPTIPIRIGTLPTRKTPFIVDGLQRLDIAQAHGLDVAVVEREYASDKEVVSEIFRLNLARRHLTVAERVEYAAVAVKEGGFSARAAATEAGVGRSSVDRKLKEDADSGGPDGAGEPADDDSKRKGRDGKRQPGTKRNREEQRVWDIQADHLAQELGSNKAAAERLGCATSTITAAKKRVAAMADNGQPAPTGRVLSEAEILASVKDDEMLRTISGAWTNFSRVEDPEEKFIRTFLAGVNATPAATASAWTQAWGDWKALRDDNGGEAGA